MSPPRVPSDPAPAQGGTPTASGGRVAVPDAATLDRWRARLDVLTRWCLSDAPLTPTAAAVAAVGRPTLGELLRRALGRSGDAVVDLLDALETPNAPDPRARLARVLGADLLLVVITAQGGQLARAEARACRTPEEATALLGAFLGGAVAPWMAAAGAHVRDAIASPLLMQSLDGSALASPHAAFARHLGDISAESTLVLPFLRLDTPPPAVDTGAIMFGVPETGPGPLLTPVAELPTVLGGVLRPGAAFLDAPALEAFVPSRDPDDAEEDAGVAVDVPVGGTAAVVDVPSHVRTADDEPALSDDTDGDEGDDDDEIHGDEVEAQGADDQGRPDALLGLADAGSVEVAPAVAPPEPPMPAAENAAALDRLRARRAPADRVSVVVASDDGVAEHVGDAAAWLAEASEQELRALARGGWTGDAAVELALAAEDPEIDDVARQARRHEAELVVEIDGDAAVAWLRRHRPETAERLEAVL